jgi:hypothetical protein
LREFNKRLLWQKLGAQLSRTAFTQQKVSVAVYEKDLCTARGKALERWGDLIHDRIGVVITNPSFEDITQEVELIGTLGYLFEEVEQRRGNLRALRLQMQV